MCCITRSDQRSLCDGATRVTPVADYHQLPDIEQMAKR
jgi:hypothetical protein